jgi:hypothetical protein
VKRATRHIGEIGHVEPCAEAIAFTRQDDGAKGAILLEAFRDRQDAFEHRTIQSVLLLRTVESDVRNTTLRIDEHSVGQFQTPFGRVPELTDVRESQFDFRPG